MGGRTGYGSSGEGGSHLPQQGRQLASKAAGQLKHRLTDVTEERKTQATGALEAVGRALRSASDNLQGEGLDPVGRIGQQAADQVDRMADYLRRRDLDGLLDDVQGMARNHPEIFLGGALLAGILVGRFLRSSTPSSREVVFEPDFGLEHGMGGSSSSSSYGSGSYGTGSSYGSGGDGSAGGPAFGGGVTGNRGPQGGWA